MLSSDQHELLTQARQRTAALLDSLNRGRAELSTSSWRQDADSDYAGGDSAFTAVIDAARGTLDNLDIKLNKCLGILLPPLSIALLAWWLYGSRGQYRFDGTTLQVPGHPPVPLNALRKIDRSRWDRKGIAYIDYQLPGTTTAGRIK